MSQQSTGPLEPGEFQDPLENYDPPTYAGGLEQALAEEPVAAIQPRPFATVTPKTSVAEAVQKLASLHIGCLLVEEDNKLVGIFSDRDILDKVALESEQVTGLPVSKVMTTEPVYVYDTDRAGAVLNVMAVSGFRHVPVLSAEGDIVGIVSPQRVTNFLKCHSKEP